MSIDPKVEKILKLLKSKKVGVFYDSSNLYHASQGFKNLKIVEI